MLRNARPLKIARHCPGSLQAPCLSSGLWIKILAFFGRFDIMFARQQFIDGFRVAGASNGIFAEGGRLKGAVNNMFITCRIALILAKSLCIIPGRRCTHNSQGKER